MVGHSSVFQIVLQIEVMMSVMTSPPVLTLVKINIDKKVVTMEPYLRKYY